MSRWYLDSSAALKLVAEEPESAALAREIDADEPDLVGCWLLETEMRRAAHRRPALSQESISRILAEIEIYEMPSSLFRFAGHLGGNLRSFDALHVAAAVRIGVDQLVTYDTRMAQAAKDAGLTVLAPA